MNPSIQATLNFALLLAITCGAQAAPLIAAAKANPAGDTHLTPSATASAEVVDELTDAGPKAATTDLDTLTAHTWRWVSFTNPVERFDVAEPATYTLSFNSDGIVEIVADCNTAIASYGVESFDAGSLSMAVAPRTKATCPPGSRGVQFLLLLGHASGYFFKDGQLFIDLTSDGGTMVFTPAETDT